MEVKVFPVFVRVRVHSNHAILSKVLPIIHSRGEILVVIHLDNAVCCLRNIIFIIESVGRKCDRNGIPTILQLFRSCRILVASKHKAAFSILDFAEKDIHIRVKFRSIKINLKRVH